ncbi:MAG: DUF805 domain-containing protein [Bdellovibrionaceae bacterium]|nr:DUF805 domain-containing protein [Pseudobdellovibrionaceae bacterium]
MEKTLSLLPDWNFLLSYEGRITRRDYWLKGQLFFFIVSFLLQVSSLYSLSMIFFILSLYSMVVINIKRAHDINKSGYFILLSLIPLLNIWVFIVLGFENSDPENNQYGPSPLPKRKTLSAYM